MGSNEVSRPKRRRWLRALIALVVLAGLAAAAYFVVTEFTGDDDEPGTLTGADNAFTIVYPDEWEPLSEEDIDVLGEKNPPLAVIRRKDGTGFLVVRAETTSPRNFDKFSKDLTREFEKRIPDFQKRSSRTIKVKAGRAFFYSYIRKTKGTVHTVVLVPAGKRSFAINTVSSGGAQKAAREIARMILSFDD